MPKENTLAKVLPCYDPCVNLCKIDILTKAKFAITQQQDELNKIVSAKEDKNFKGDFHKKLQERVTRLKSRNEQLRNLLTTSGISIPKSVGTISLRDNKFKKASPEQAKIFQKHEMERLNKLAQNKTSKIISAPKKLKRPIIDTKSKNSFPLKRKKSATTDAAAPCLIVLPQPSINAGINNSCFLIPNQNITPAKTIQSATGLSTTLPLINPPLSSLGPGTLLLSNGTVIPIVPKQQVLLSNQLIISNSTNSLKPNITTASRSGSAKADNECEKSVTITTVGNTSVKPINQPSKLHPVKPKCVTITTQMNKVPIPALTSRYANSKSLFTKETAESKKGESQKGKDISKTKKVSMCKKKVEIDTKKNEGNSDEEQKKDENKNELEKETVSEESMKVNSSEIVTTQVNTVPVTCTDELNLNNVSASVSSASSNQEDQNVGDTRVTVENDQIPHEKSQSIETVSCDNGQVPVEKESILEVTEKRASESLDISHSEENLTCSESLAPCDDSIKNLGLNLVHSELSNDLFASLHVPPGCQNPESTSPTAAFLMAFPLVSSVKATDVNEDDQSSQRQTPTLLQIGTMDTTKHTNTETLSGSLLNLDSFSFFNSKDVCESYYESCTSNINESCSDNITKENQISTEVKNKVETRISVATNQPNSSNVPQKTNLKNSSNIHYGIFQNPNDNDNTNVHQYISTGKMYAEYDMSIKSSINNTNESELTEINMNKNNDVLNIVENVSCNTYPEFVKGENGGKESNSIVLVSTKDSEKNEQSYNESVKSNTYGKSQNPKGSCYQNNQMKETQDFITCQETELKNLSDVTFPLSVPDKDILKTNHYNMFQGSSRPTEKLSTCNEEILCNYTQQQIHNPCIDASSNRMAIQQTLIHNDKDESPKKLFKKSNVDYEHHQNMIPQTALYKSFHSIPESDIKKKNTEGSANIAHYVYPRNDLKHSNSLCTDINKHSVDIPAVIMDKGNSNIYSVDNMPFNQFQMEPIHRTELKTYEKPLHNKPTENIALNIFETTQSSKAINSSGKTDNSNISSKLSHSLHLHNYKKDVTQKISENKSQCYYSSPYTDNSYNIGYKSDASKLCPTCSYMNLNKSYSNPLYTNSTNYNYYPDSSINQNYFKTSTTRTDTKSYYSLNYENYQEYKKSEGNNPKCYGTSSTIQRNQDNAAKEKCVSQNKLVNWMTAPENKVQPPDSFLTFPNQSFTSCVSGDASEIGNLLEPKKMDIPLLAEDKQFSWSHSKLPNFLDQSHNFVTPTLPTLVGDLALGNPVPFNEQKIDNKFAKDQKRKNNVYENQTNFLSVSQLVDHNKVEIAPSRVTARRSSGGKSKNAVQVKNKRPGKNEGNDKNAQTKSTNVFNAMHSNGLFNEQKSGNHNKNTPSSYSAEALIGNQMPDSSKKYPSSSSKTTGSSNFLTENIINHFPAIEENYMNQNQNFHNNVYTNNPFQTTNHSSISTNNFVYSTPTIPATYLSSNFDAPCYEYTDNLNILSSSTSKDNKFSSKPYRQPTNSKDEKNVSYPNCAAKKSKKKIGNESINSGFANFEFPLLPIPGSTNSPILPDDFHTHTSFLAPTAPYPTKPTMYQKQGNDFPPNGLLPLPGLSRNNSQLPEVSPSLNSVGTSLTNFNLSTIFPEINKGSVSNVYQDNRNKEHSTSLQMPFNLEPKYSFSG